MSTALFPQTPDDERLREMLHEGAREADAGRADDAERIFRWVLSATRGKGSKIERLACSNMVAFFARQGRDVEILALARRHVDLSSASGDAEDVCFALGGLACAYVNLEDWPRFDVAASRFESALHSADGAWTAKLSRALFRARTQRALAAQDVEGARRELGRAHDVAPGEEETPFERRAALLLEAEIALRKGRPSLACEALDGVAALNAPGGAAALETARLAATCALELKGPAAAAAVIACTLDVLESPDAAHNGTAPRLRCAQRLGDLAAARCREPALAKRAYDVAATVVLLRGAEIERAARLIPETCVAQPDDFAALSDYRGRFATQQREIRRAVARLLQSRVAAGDVPGWTREPGRTTTDVCAWCLRVRVADGTLVPVGHFLGKDAGIRLNHVLCGDCEPLALR